MAKTYRMHPGQRAINRVYRQLTLWGLGARYRHILTVAGRTSGLPRSTPVDVMEVGGERYLVAPYGEVNWVRNLRVARAATLRRGRRIQVYDAREVAPEDAVPAIRAYVRSVKVTRSYWDIDDDATDDQVREEARRHPVFRLSLASS